MSPRQIDDLGIEVLPQNLGEALSALRYDPLFADTLGKGIIGEFITIKQAEWTEYHRHVSEWEVDRYLSFY